VSRQERWAGEQGIDDLALHGEDLLSGDSAGGFGIPDHQGGGDRLVLVRCLRGAIPDHHAKVLHTLALIEQLLNEVAEGAIPGSMGDDHLELAVRSKKGRHAFRVTDHVANVGQFFEAAQLGRLNMTRGHAHGRRFDDQSQTKVILHVA
jgi:hypothetical protein